MRSIFEHSFFNSAADLVNVVEDVDRRPDKKNFTSLGGSGNNPVALATSRNGCLCLVAEGLSRSSRLRFFLLFVLFITLCWLIVY